MCGIVGYVGQQEAKDLLLEGLKKLEYRGYDSAGIAILNGDIHLFKSPGNIASLESTLPSTIEGKCGIAHTRWATHGAPNQTNAHPHVSNSGDMTMVHNGIIENYQELKKELRDKGYSFKSDTDSEVLLNLIEFEYNQNGQDAADAIRKATSRVKGTYAIGLLIKGESDKIYAIRCGSPLIIAKAQEGFYMASDLNAFSTTTDEVFFPEDHDLIILNTQEGIRTINAKGNEIRMISETFQAATNSTGKNGFEDYMLKEIFEQEETVPLAMVYSGKNKKIQFPHITAIEEQLKSINRIIIIGCGTSWHAGLIGNYLFEKYARIPSTTEYASEFRYRQPVIGKGDLIIALSQSGETADTLAATRLAKTAGATTLVICNVPRSTLTRETDAHILLNAGPEIGVASTKAFTSQVAILTQLAFYISDLRNIEHPEISGILKNLAGLSIFINKILGKKNQIKELAEKYSFAQNFLFIGRGINYPTALEGALKLKEISYIHAEGYPGAEMKHGPIALIDSNFPTVAIATDEENRLKMISNIHEIQARGGNVIVLIRQGDDKLASMADDYIEIPATNDEAMPILSIIPLQMFSYYMAKFKGCNVDQPRNLAKSVTVE